MNKQTVIMLAGNRRVGKDTFFILLNKLYPNKFVRFAFADALKEDLNPISQKMFGKNTLDLDNREKEVMRGTLIGYGCGWREIDPLHWVKIIDLKIKKDYSGSKIIPCIVDGRFLNEIAFFKQDYNLIVVGIERQNAVEPTEEEKKNWPEVAGKVDYWVRWHDAKNNISELELYATNFYNSYFVPQK